MTSVPAPAAPPPLSFGVKFSYGLGSYAVGISGIVLSGGLLQLYFNQVLGLPPAWVGAAIMVTIVLDAVIDPAIGVWSDGLRSPLGRRHLPMYISAIPSAIAFWLIWQTPPIDSQWGMLGWMVGLLLFARIAISLYEIPSASLAPELAPNYDERTSLLAWRFFFFVNGLGITGFVLFALFLRGGAADPAAILDPAPYARFGAVAAVMIFVAILISTAATQRRIRLLHVPPIARKSLRELIAEGSKALSHRPLLLLMTAAALFSFSAAVSDGLAIYFNLHFWRLPPSLIAYVVGGGALASFLGLFLAPVISQRFGKKRAMLWVYFLWLLSAIVPGAMRLLGVFPANDSPLLLPLLVTIFVLGVTCLFCALTIVGSMISDCIDDIAVRSGRRSEGLLLAVYGVLVKWAQGGGAFAAGLVVAAVHFPARAVPGTVDMAILNEMAVIFLVVVSAANLGAIYFLSRYRLTRAAHEANLAVLGEAAALSREEEVALHREPPGDVKPASAN